MNVNTEVKTKFNSLNVAVEKSKNVETVKTKNGKNEPKKRLSPPRHYYGKSKYNIFNFAKNTIIYQYTVKRKGVEAVERKPSVQIQYYF